MSIQPSLSLTEISANGSAAKTILTELFSNLRDVKTEEDILQAGVSIVRQALKCDRAVVYSMQAESYCKIVAEAVTPGYTQILGRTIKDPCFEAGYIEKYSKGRVRAITDIHKSGINPCHIENLEKIEVKSNLVVPIVRQDNSLYGLLVMHQCSRSREWQQSEVEFVLHVSGWLIEELAKHEYYSALELQVKNAKEARQLVTTATQQIHRAVNSQEALQFGVLQAKEIINCDRVVIYGLQEGNMGKIVAEATAPALAPILGNVIKDPCFEYRYSEQYESGRVRATPNVFEAGLSECYIDSLAKIGVRSNLVAGINWDNGKIFGLLVAHQCFDFKDWQPDEIENFKEIAFHTGLSLSKAIVKERTYTIETGLHQLSHVKDTVNLAKSKIEQIKQPMQDTGKILVEINNLNKLLEREIDQINQNGLAQTKKDTKLIQIIARKLISITSKIKNSLTTVNTSSNEAKLFLDEASAYIDGNQSEFD
ncbi:MAG: GAF domain-containing protein [Pleurocapsa minor HA4230-MV1]|jgi:methyl-accepting chemotaxis protein PixJ|nr:GAF domain-containing protein [Pleurocapsa minor HA4230-MV1]